MRIYLNVNIPLEWGVGGGGWGVRAERLAAALSVFGYEGLTNEGVKYTMGKVGFGNHIP